MISPQDSCKPILLLLNLCQNIGPAAEGVLFRKWIVTILASSSFRSCMCVEA